MPSFPLPIVLSRRRLCAALLAAGLLAQAACGALPPRGPVSADRAWKVGEARFVAFDDLLAQARGADIVLLGETHDNAMHHAAQRLVLESLAPARPTLVMEQFDLEQQAGIDAILQSGRSRQDKLDAFKALMKPGWEWSGYEGLLATALDRRLPVLAANISREALREVSRKGLSVLGEGASAQLGLDAGWSGAQQASLRREVSDSHCGMLPDAAVTAMTGAQRVRDAVMADRLLSVRGSAVAILGRGHVRQDLAVPVYLRLRAPERRVLSVALAEGGHAPETAQPYDYVVYTEAVERTVDPCAAFSLPAQGPATR